MKFSKYLICLCIIISLNCTNVCATEINNIEINEVQTVEEIELNEQKDKLKQEVVDLVEELRVGITSIDEKVEKLRETDEYSTYPTVRLNIDTPIFGIKSVINQKLKITKDISPKDVAKGYSIRDVVKNKAIKIPDMTIGSIVVSTKDINIESDLQVTEYNTLILKLMNYKDKVKSVEEFLDIQTNKIFKEYVSKDKKEKLENLSSKLEKINSDLLNQNDVLEKIYLVGYDKYNDLEERYIKLITLQKELSKNSSDVLIDSNKLNELQKQVLSLESDVIDYLSEIEKISVEYFDKIEIDKVYLKAYSKLKSKLEYIENYIEESKKEEIIKEELETNKDDLVENNTENNDESVKLDESSKTTEIITLYEVFSDKSVNSMKDIILHFEKRMNELGIVYNELDEYKDFNSTEEVSSNSENENKYEKEKIYEEFTKEQIETEINNLIKKYNEFLKYQYTFYLDNVNGLLKLTNTKVKNIATVTESDILEEARYVYLDLPVNLEKYLDTYNVNSNIEIKYLISNFKNELSKLCKNYLNLVKLYEELNVDELLNKA